MFLTQTTLMRIYQDLLLKNGLKFMINQEEITILIKKLETKHQSMGRSDLCDYSDAYIVVKGVITVEDQITHTKKNKATTFKNNAPFINCISKINGVKIDSAENLDVVMPMYNLFAYGKNYRKTTSSLWNYYRDEPSKPLSSNSESFKYKTSITGNSYYVGDDEEGYDANKVGKNETEVVIPLKHLNNQGRRLNILLIS